MSECAISRKLVADRTRLHALFEKTKCYRNDPLVFEHHGKTKRPYCEGACRVEGQGGTQEAVAHYYWRLSMLPGSGRRESAKAT